MFRRIWIPVVAALVAGMGLVGAGSSALADEPEPAPDVQARSVDVYTTPGYHDVNGRRWHTTCESYSTSVDRCRAEIWATQVRFSGGRYREITDWYFNNLTYKPSPREHWEGNPLGNKGMWTSTEGRQWKTDCDTAETGRNGCRSYIMSKDIVVKTLTPRTYERVDRWVFNNVVQFTVPKPVDPPPPPPKPKVWCDNAPLPYNMALRNKDGLPYYTNAPYDPKDVYNPNTVANFIKNVSNDGRLSKTSRECLANLGGKHLIDGSHTEGSGANTVRWFGYRFDFSPNPNVPPLSGKGDGWFSGLAQGGVLSAFVEMDKITGDAKWLKYGREAFRSFDVPMQPDGSGGITNHITVDGKDVLWFEEYPTAPATSVLNGHLEAIIGLDIWFKATGEQHARELRDQALDGLEPALNQDQLDVQGGMLTSYDLVRGYWDKDRDYFASPIRYVNAKPGATGVVTQAQLNGKDVTLPKAVSSAKKPNKLLQSTMEGPNGTWPKAWQQVVTSSKTELVGGRMKVTTRGVKGGWQGVSQVIPANKLSGKRLALSLDSELITPGNGTKKGVAGKVAIYELCNGKTTGLVFETQKMRSRDKTGYTMSFTPRNANCDLLLQLMTSSYGDVGTTIYYDNVELREADDEGAKLDIAPTKTPFTLVSQFVYEEPTQQLTLTGSGTVAVQAYEDGQWQNISPRNLTLDPSSPVTVQIPERLTGRNIHYGYHEHHVDELVSLYNRTKADRGKEREFLREYAQSWVKMAPAKIGTVPAAPKPDARMLSVDDPGDTYDIEIIDPFSLLEEE